MSFSNAELLLTIFGMFVVTFGGRFVLLARADRVRLPATIEQALQFIPVTVLTALIIPFMLLKDSEWAITWHNPWLIAGIIAFITGIIWRNTLLTIALGMVIFIAMRFLGFN